MSEGIEHGALPWQHGEWMVMTAGAGRDGADAFDGFGVLRIRAAEGRGVVVEITDELHGRTMTAALDWGRPRRARTNMQVPDVCAALQAASRDDGMPTPMPEAL